MYLQAYVCIFYLGNLVKSGHFLLTTRHYNVYHFLYDELTITLINILHSDSLSELPESHMEIASNEDALNQLTCISLTPSLRILSPQLVATLFLCLAYTPQTHKHITNPTFIRRLLEAYKILRTNSSDDLEEALSLLK